jgi:hypothetical protein
VNFLSGGSSSKNKYYDILDTIEKYIHINKTTNAYKSDINFKTI